MFLKPLRFLAFPMTSSSSFLLSALAALIPYILTLLCLSLVHFSLFYSRVLFESSWKKKPNSSTLKITWSLYHYSIVHRCVSLQWTIISGVHNFASPDFVLNVTLSCAFHLSTHPFNALKSPISSFFQNHLLSLEGPQSTHSCIIWSCGHKPLKNSFVHILTFPSFDTLLFQVNCSTAKFGHYLVFICTQEPCGNSVSFELLMT